MTGRGNRSLDSTLFALFSAVTNIRRTGGRPVGFLYNVSPELKTLGIFVFIVLLALSPNESFILLCGSFFLLSLSSLHRDDIVRMFSIMLPAAGFTILVLIPYMLTGHVHKGLILLVRILTASGAAALLAHTTGWRHLVRSLKFYRVPDILVQVLETAVRFILVLGYFSIHALQSLKLRNLGAVNKTGPVLSRTGVLFLKSRQYASLTASAMECRCFDGTYPRPAGLMLKPLDYLFILFLVLITAAFILLAGGRS